MILEFDGRAKLRYMNKTENISVSQVLRKSLLSCVVQITYKRRDRARKSIRLPDHSELQERTCDATLSPSLLRILRAVKKPKVSILVAVRPAATPVPGRLHDRLFHAPLRNAGAELRLGHAHGPFRVMAHDIAAAEPPSPLAAALAALEEAASLKGAARAACTASILCGRESFVSLHTSAMNKSESSGDSGSCAWKTSRGNERLVRGSIV